MIKKLLKYMTLFCASGVIYLFLEIMWNGSTHISSFFMCGIMSLLTGYINEYFSWETPLGIQAILGGGFATIIEFVTGLLINRDLQIWNYSDYPFNLFGQICLQYSMLWACCAVIAILLDDYIRWKLFNEEKPRYKLF